jgi:hypothetical protein
MLQNSPDRTVQFIADFNANAAPVLAKQNSPENRARRYCEEKHLEAEHKRWQDVQQLHAKVRMWRHANPFPWQIFTDVFERDYPDTWEGAFDREHDRTRMLELAPYFEERQAAAKVRARLLKANDDLTAALAERDGWGGTCTVEQATAWAAKYQHVYFPGSGGYPLSGVNIVPFPKPLPTPPLPSNTAPAPQQLALPLVFFNQVRERPRRRALIRKFLTEGATSSIYGAPKTNKSTLAADIGVHVAAGKDWRGYQIKQARGVVYFAFERGAQVQDALDAYAKRDGLENLPFAVCGHMVDMIGTGCVDVIMATIRAAEAQFRIRVGLVVFDTWNKGIAAGGGSEDKAEHQNAAAANLRRLIEAMPALHCLTIGHTGKDATKGERGSNATMGDRDVGVLVEAFDKSRVATIVYANDLPEGRLTAFEPEAIEIGTNEDGDTVTGLVVSAAEIAAPMQKSGRPKKLTPKDRLALQALGDALKAHGKLRPEFPGRSVTRDEWLDACFKSGAIGRDASRPNRDLDERQVRLLDEKLILVNGELGLIRITDQSAANDMAVTGKVGAKFEQGNLPTPPMPGQ